MKITTARPSPPPAPAVEVRGVVDHIFESPDGQDYIHVGSDDRSCHDWKAACVPATRGAHGFSKGQRVIVSVRVVPEGSNG